MLRSCACSPEVPCSLMSSLFPASRPFPSCGVGLPPRWSAATTAGRGWTATASARRPGHLPFALDPCGACVAAVLTGGHRHVVAQAADEVGVLDRDRIRVVHGTHASFNS